jgi:ketosteroid isomerase-like protein
MASAASEILGIEKQMVRDFNSGKIDELISQFHPQVVGFSSTQHERIAGRRAMRKTFDYYRRASSEIRYRISDPEVKIFADTAVATFHWTVELGSGNPRHSVQGRGSHVFARNKGRWLIVHEHFSRAR